MTTKRKTLIAAGVLAVLVSAGTAWSSRTGVQGTARVERGDLVGEVVAPGLVEPVHDQVALGFETSGRVAEVLVEEGDRVQRGQLLVRLDDRLARARVAAAEAALSSMRARRDLTAAGSREPEIRAAQAETEAARAQARDRAVARDRADRLLAGGALSQADADSARDAAEAARATAAAVEARLDLVRQGERSEVKRSAHASALAAEAELEQARALLAQTELRAPRDGVVLRRMVEVGEQVVTTPPKVVLTIADLDRLQLRVEIDESDVGRVAIGQPGFVTSDAYTSRFPGRIVRIQRELGRKSVRLDDPHARADTRVLEVVFELDAQPELPLGLRMDVHLETLDRRDVLKVPLSAVRRPAARAREGEVTVLAGGQKATRKVHLGADDGHVVEVTDGLREGDSVAIR
jgi:multidrug resistance efflux pump